VSFLPRPELGLGLVQRGLVMQAKLDAIIDSTLQTKPAGMTQWSCRLMAEAQEVGKDTVNRLSASATNGFQGSSQTVGEQQVVDLELQPRAFTTLWKGGPQYRGLVQAVAFQSGRRWSNGKTWKHVVFPQF